MKVSKQIRNIGLVHYLGVLAALLLLVFGYFFLAPHTQEVSVVIRLADKDMIWLDNGSPRSVSVESIRPGIKETDAFGRVSAEVVRVSSFDQPVRESQYTQKKTVYVTLRLRASYNEKKDQYRYQGTVLQMGDWVRFTVQSSIINGLVMQIPSREDQQQTPVLLNAQLKTEGPFTHEPFSETTGVDRYIADAITVGDKVTDSEGNVLAEVLEKTVNPATRITIDQYGVVHTQQDTRKYDVMLSLRVTARRIGDELYYLDLVRLKVNAPLPLFLSKIDIEPRITEIVSVGK
jgi:hypothetical protein